MMSEPLFGNDQLVADLLRSLRDQQEASLHTTPKLLRRTLETGAWREFNTPLREHVKHDRFEDFVTADPFAGLGTTMDVIRGFMKADDELRRILADQIEPATASAGKPTNDSTSIILPDRGATAANTVARLKREDPDLAEKVVNGEVSAYAAARRRGWRKPSIIVSSPERVAASLRKHMTADEVRVLARLLNKEA